MGDAKLTPAQSVGQICRMLDDMDAKGELTPPHQRMTALEKADEWEWFEIELAKNAVVRTRP